MMIYVDNKHRPKRKRKKVLAVLAEPKVKRPWKDLETLPSRPLRQSDAIPSRNTGYFVEPKMPIKYEGEMAEREALAQEEIERKKKMVAPLYNKGGYQYVGDAPPEIIKTLGRKV